MNPLAADPRPAARASIPVARAVALVLVLVLVLVLALALALAACGEEPPSKDRSEEALAALRGAMTSGPGMDAARLLDVVQQAGLTLWPGTGPEDAAAHAAQRTHQQVAIIAADVARDVARDPAERQAWLERDPESVAIHDGFLAAVAKGVSAYRAWVEGEGARLLADLRDRRDRLLAPPR